MKVALILSLCALLFGVPLARVSCADVKSSGADPILLPGEPLPASQSNPSNVKPPASAPPAAAAAASSDAPRVRSVPAGAPLRKKQKQYKNRENTVKPSKQRNDDAAAQQQQQVAPQASPATVAADSTTSTQNPPTTVGDSAKTPPQQPSPSEITAGARGSVPLGDAQRGTDLSDANLIHTDTPRDEKAEIARKLAEAPEKVAAATPKADAAQTPPPVQQAPEVPPPQSTADAVSPTPASQPAAPQQPVAQAPKPSELQPTPAQTPLPPPPTDAAVAAAKAEAAQWSASNTKDASGQPILTPSEEKDVRCEACCATGKGGHGSAACEAAHDGKDAHCCGRSGFDGYQPICCPVTTRCQPSGKDYNCIELPKVAEL